MPNRSFMALAAVLAACLPAGAADLEPMLMTAPELTPVEVGNGWYLRGDLSYDFSTDLDGSASIGPASTSFDNVSLEDGLSGGLGIGYQFTDLFRMDLTGRYGKFDVDAAFASSEAETWDVMANAYLDLGTFAGFSPYVGGGIGAVNVSYGDVALCAAGTCAGIGEGDDSWRFAYALTGGVSYDLTRNLAVDVAYRYLDVEGGRIFDATDATSGLRFVADDDGFDRHSVTAGLRYSLW